MLKGGIRPPILTRCFLDRTLFVMVSQPSITGQSGRVQSMISDHRLVERISQAHEELADETEALIAHVKTCLPARKERWWEAATQNPESEEAALRALKTKLMLEASPLEVVFESAQKMEDEASGRLRAKRSLQGHIEALRFRKKQILEKREAYKDLLARKDRIYQEGNGDRYEAAWRVRRAASTLNLSPLVQVNQMQAALRKEIPLETGFPEADADTPGEGAARTLVYQNRPPSWEDKLEKRRRPERELVEDAIWALFLSIASGDPVPGAGAEIKDAGWVITCPGTDVLRS